LKEEQSPTGMPVAALPFLSFDAAPVESGREISRPDALLGSLVHEITVAVPSDSSSSVDIQFDSRTLDGLHVRVQNSGGGVDVRFSTSSETVSRLLTANSSSLVEALVQRGYVAPAVSVHPAEGSTTYPDGGSKPSDRRGGDRGKSDQGSGQKRR